MRRRQLKALWKRLKVLSGMKLKRDDLLLKIGAAKQQRPAGWRLVNVQPPKADQPVNQETFTFTLRKDKLRQIRCREGRYLMHTNLSAEDPQKLWTMYVQLTQVEAAFKDLKHYLGRRPIYHQLEHRIEAHIFVAFLAYCLHVTLRGQLRGLAGGLTPGAELDKPGEMQTVDGHFPTTDGRELVFCRYTQPEKDQKILLAQLGWELPPQSPPKITAKGTLLND